MDCVRDKLDELAQEGKLDDEIRNCQNRLEEYQKALEMFTAYQARVRKGAEELDHWKLAADNLINRAQVGIVLLRSRRPGADSHTLARQAKLLLAQMRTVEDQTRQAMALRLKPTRLNRIMDWLYAPVDAALTQVASADGLLTPVSD